MKLAYFLGVSVIDYPGKVASVVWTVGCNLRCPFCYNSDLVLPEKITSLELLDPDWVLNELRERTGFVQGLAVTGGEPTIHRDLPDFLERVKSLGLGVKLDSNGTNPGMLRELFREKLVDYIAVDIKAPFPRYTQFTGLPPDRAREVVEKVKESIGVIRSMAPAYEFRTTVVPGITEEDLAWIKGLVGGSHYVLQPFFLPQGKELIDENWKERAHISEVELEEIAHRLGCQARTQGWSP